MAKKVYEESNIAAIANKIREKTGGESTYKTSEMPLGIDAVYNTGFEAGKAEGGGKVAIEEKDVNFYDYDGTLLYSYTLEEAQGLTELPPAPDRSNEGLVFYEWNWSLENIKAENCRLDVGALYDTDDSKAHIHITIGEFDTRTVPLVVRGTGYIDWGDGSDVVSVSDASNATYTHEYTSIGDYVIKVWFESNTRLYLGHSSGTTNCFGTTSNQTPVIRSVRKVFVGTKCYCNHSAFKNCSQLEYATVNPNHGFSHSMFMSANNLVCCHGARREYKNNYYTFRQCRCLRIATLSDACEWINSGMFRECYSLKRLLPRKNITFIEGYMFYTASSILEARGQINSSDTSMMQGCNSLRRFDIHEASTGIPQDAFSSCYMLESVNIPATVTTIGAQAFYCCYTIGRIKFNSATPPTVANANAFTGIPSTCIVEVPAASLEAYKAATNYGSIAAQMVGV